MSIEEAKFLQKEIYRFNRKWDGVHEQIQMTEKFFEEETGKHKTHEDLYRAVLNRVNEYLKDR